MLESFDRRRNLPLPEVNRRVIRDISRERAHTGVELIERYVKCDGLMHTVELEIVSFDPNGNPEYGNVEKIGEPVPCTCTEAEKQRGDSVWDIFK
jgi:hypothetical protein